MLPEVFCLYKWYDQPKRTFDFIQHSIAVSVLQRCLEIWRKRMRTKEVVDKLQCFIGRIGDFEQGQIGF